MNTNKDIKPILKWIGGKRQLLPSLRKFTPKEFNTYYEPFIGGGAMLFDLVPVNANVSDINHELINIYQIVKSNVDALIAELEKYVPRNTPHEFLQIRSMDRTSSYDNLTNIERAARLLYLNKTSFNGLYRTNSKGEFNSSYGHYENPRILEENNLRAVSAFLNSNNINLSVNSYSNALKDAKAGDFIFLDPPYIPLSATSSFTSYTKEKFNLNNQKELAEIMEELDCLGCYVLMTNSSAELTYDTYVKGNFIADELLVQRSVGATAQSRAKVKELFIYNKNLKNNLQEN